jgi:hypothetical protein
MLSKKKKSRKSADPAKARKAAAVPFARGFKPPSRGDALAAIGPLDGPADRIFHVGLEQFEEVPAPVSENDWLAQYKEGGQTFDEFLQWSPWLCTRKVKYIKHRFVSSGKTMLDKYPDGKLYILPLGEFTGLAPDVDALVDYTQRFHCQPVELLPAAILEHSEAGRVTHVVYRGQRHHLPGRFHTQSGHRQLRVNELLQWLARHVLPDNATCLVAVTMCDLYDTEPDLFVAGMAAGQMRVGVFTFFRYDPALTFSDEFWFQFRRAPAHKSAGSKVHRALGTSGPASSSAAAAGPEGSQVRTTTAGGTNVESTVTAPAPAPAPAPAAAHAARKLMLLRSCKILVHELGHMLGLDHCIHFRCCMNGSGHLVEDFAQPMFLCPIDLRKVHALTGCDIARRYQGLLEFFTHHGLVEEAVWLRARIATLESASAPSTQPTAVPVLHVDDGSDDAHDTQPPRPAKAKLKAKAAPGATRNSRPSRDSNDGAGPAECSAVASTLSSRAAAAAAAAARGPKALQNVGRGRAAMSHQDNDDDDDDDDVNVDWRAGSLSS